MDEHRFQEGLKRLSEFKKVDLDKYPHLTFVFEVFVECKRRIENYEKQIKHLQSEVDYWKQLCEGYEQFAEFHINKQRGKT